MATGATVKERLGNGWRLIVARWMATKWRYRALWLIAGFTGLVPLVLFYPIGFWMKPNIAVWAIQRHPSYVVTIRYVERDRNSVQNAMADSLLSGEPISARFDWLEGRLGPRFKQYQDLLGEANRLNEQRICLNRVWIDAQRMLRDLAVISRQAKVDPIRTLEVSRQLIQSRFAVLSDYLTSDHTCRPRLGEVVLRKLKAVEDRGNQLIQSKGSSVKSIDELEGAVQGLDSTLNGLLKENLRKLNSAKGRMAGELEVWRLEWEWCEVRWLLWLFCEDAR